MAPLPLLSTRANDASNGPESLQLSFDELSRRQAPIRCEASRLPPLHAVRQSELPDASAKLGLPMSFAGFEPSEFTFKYANPVKKLPCKG